MKIILDAFGGDNAPAEALKGRSMAVKELGVTVLAVGDIAKMQECCKAENIDTDGIEFKQAEGVFDMHREPMDIVKKAKDTSLYVAFKALSDGEGDALVSAGSTGAILMGATFITKRIRGCKRPALGFVLPGESKSGFLLMDCGANSEVKPEMLNQFATIGSIYMSKVAGVANPRVALLNNGAEDTKGTPVHVEAYKLLKENKDINFVGNIEGRYMMNDIADVVVADGFSGNVALKTTEGTASFMNKQLKAMFKANILTKFAALLMMRQINGLRAKMDYTEYGGAPVLGVTKGVIKAHGSSDAKAFKNAIRQAKIYTDNNVSAIIAENLTTGEETEA